MKYKNRLKSFAWRLSAMAFVAISSYIISIGDIWQLDIKTLINFSVITIIGLIAGEITKALNTNQ